MKKAEIKILTGDNRAVMKTFAEDSFHAIVCDPPYELGFMGKKWDSSGIAYDAAVWTEAWRVLKPGGYLLAFGGSRTYHRLATAIEDAGFEIRDMIEWLYGSGFPKSLDVSKAMDKAAGAERERNVTPAPRSKLHGGRPWMDDPNHKFFSKEAVSDDAKKWNGWGTALKPAHEPICVARKPLIGTVVENVLAHGTGALNVDAGRIQTAPWHRPKSENPAPRMATTFAQEQMAAGANEFGNAAGRWPANVAHDGSADVLAGFAGKSSGHGHFPKHPKSTNNGIYGKFNPATFSERQMQDNGDTCASRFFYTAKASGTDRGNQVKAALPLFGVAEEEFRNTHPTVKPIALMTWLLKLVCPPGAHVLDPFAGSGSTLVAAQALGVDCTGIELLPEHVAIIQQRLAQK